MNSVSFPDHTLKAEFSDGRIKGVLASLKCRVEYLKPDWWQRTLQLGKSADHANRWKAYLKERAQALFPRVEVTLKTADALLILEAGRMQSANQSLP